MGDNGVVPGDNVRFSSTGLVIGGEVIGPSIEDIEMGFDKPLPLSTCCVDAMSKIMSMARQKGRKESLARHECKVAGRWN